jgi:nucleoside-diphosphate-sugar epimerase
MKVLVTGGAGYLGSLLCPVLLEEGHEVILFDAFLWGVKPILHFVSNPGLEIVMGDIRDAGVLRPLIARADAIVHLAAIVGYPACAADPVLAESTNVGGTQNVVSLCSKHQPLVFACTGSTYGQVDGVCTEETPINPLTLYGRTKSEGEKMALSRGGVSLRFATVFGVSPRLRLDLLVNDFCYQAYHNRFIVMFEGHHRRTFLHARDAAAAILFALARHEDMRGKSFNVGSDDMNYTKVEVAGKVMEYQPFYLHQADVGRDEDKRDYEVSYSRIRSLGFKAAYSLDDGIRELLRVVPYIRMTSEWRNA